MRLAGGTYPGQGRVEIYLNSLWGTVCDDGWGIEEALVVCRQLGFFGADNAYGNARYGEGIGPIHLDDVRCIGSEARLAQCSHIGVGNHNCAHFEDAGVACSRSGTKNYF